MYRHQDRARFGPHSIHDARQYAWSVLIFGPGAPAPRQRVHPGLLPDVYIAGPAHAGSPWSRFIALFRRKRAEVAQAAEVEPKEELPDAETGLSTGRQATHDTSLPATRVAAE